MSSKARPSPKMPFGKYSGWLLSELPDYYVKWLFSLTTLREPLHSEIQDEWRTRFGCQEDSFADAVFDAEDRALYTELVRAGYRALAKIYHPDVGGAPETMRRLNRLMERLRGGLAA